MDYRAALAGILFVFSSLFIIGCVGGEGHPPPDWAEAQGTSLAWIQSQSPTYAFDGISSSLKSFGYTSSPPCWNVTYAFQSAHAGYGNRSGLMLAEVITSHNTAIQVCNGTVTSAITDGAFDEMGARPLAPAANDSDATQIANPASVHCIRQGGTLVIRSDASGEVGYCTLPDGTLCEEWAFLRGECPAVASGAGNKTYVHTTPNCVINFMCIQGTVPFSDEKGCGCEPVPEMSAELCNASGGHWAQVVIDIRQACMDRGETNCPYVPAYLAQVCKCGGIAGFQCPAGYACTDYRPSPTTPDAMGTCALVK